jgi:hypothetical protein
MPGVIFQVSGDRLTRLEERPYDSEARLQKLLADYPDLLGGDQMDQENPRRWLHVGREVGVPDAEAGADRWALDHLFLDQDGIPTFVEVKRSSDTRIRREVVGQMFDYAANALRYWPAGRIRSLFEASLKDGERAEQRLEDALGVLGPEDYWRTVASNLERARLRLLFVADEIPAELRTVIEFLNAQLTNTEVLGVEVRQFVGAEFQNLVPLVIGQSRAARIAKSGAASPQRPEPWTADEFLQRVAGGRSPEDAALVRRLLDWAALRGVEVNGGRGPREAALFFHARRGDAAVHLFSLGTVQGSTLLYVQLERLAEASGTDDIRAEVCARLNRIEGVTLDPARSYPSISLATLRDGQRQAALVDALDWLVHEAQRARV